MAEDGTSYNGFKVLRTFRQAEVGDSYSGQAWQFYLNCSMNRVSFTLVVFAEGAHCPGILKAEANLFKWKEPRKSGDFYSDFKRPRLFSPTRERLIGYLNRT